MGFTVNRQRPTVARPSGCPGGHGAKSITRAANDKMITSARKAGPQLMAKESKRGKGKGSKRRRIGGGKSKG